MIIKPKFLQKQNFLPLKLKCSTSFARSTATLRADDVQHSSRSLMVADDVADAAQAHRYAISKLVQASALAIVTLHSNPA